MLTGWRKAVSKLFIIPQRYVLAFMGMFGVCNAYTMRVCLGLAITQMVKKTSSSEEHFDPDACPDPHLNTSSRFMTRVNYVYETEYFDWSEATQGLLLSSFYYGYVVTHIPGGMLSERFGGKWVLGIGLLSTALCTLATPVVTKAGGAFWLFALRVVEGFGEGPTMPALMAILARWAPATERARIGAIVFGGAQIGNILGSYLSGLIMSAGPWDNVFYVFGGLGLIWFVFWIILCYSTPNTHPFISDEEKEYLNDNIEAITKTERLNPVPWKALLRSVPLWALIIAGIGHDWGYFTMVTDLPKYMTDVLKFNIKTTGTLSALPYVCMWIASFFFGIVCDFCIKRGYHKINTARKIYTTIAATGPGICIILASYSGCDTYLAVAWFIAAMTLMGAYYSGMKINALDITPNYAGTTTAMVNGIAATSGIISPYLIGLLTPDSTLKQWRIAFWICLVILVVTNIVYILFSSGEQLWWDEVDKHGYPKGWKHGPLPVTKSSNKLEKNDQSYTTYPMEKK